MTKGDSVISHNSAELNSNAELGFGGGVYVDNSSSKEFENISKTAGFN